MKANQTTLGLPYTSPSIQALELDIPNQLFVTLSLCGEVDDWEDGGELE